LVFPEGQRTPHGNLQPAQPGLGLVIAKTLAPVVPMRVFGAYQAWPIHEKWPRPGRITIVVGEPIFFTSQEVEAGGKELYQRLSQRVMDAIAALSLE
jgi:1-acyl-sn-glycerol-3-phosphate acyltransferase